MIRLVALRELRSLFYSSSTWFVFAAFQFVLAWFYLTRLETFLDIQPQLAKLSSPPGATASLAVPMFSTLALLLMMLVPIFTMRLIAEERRNMTLPLLLSAPLTDWELVLGKFAGMLTFVILLCAGVPVMLYTLMLGTHLDHGMMLSNVFGLSLLAASYIALGMYFSALTSQPVVAAISAFAALLALWFMDASVAAPDSAWHQLSPLHHFQNLNNGLFDTADLSFFTLFIGVFLLLTARRLYNNRRYG